ncbi:hypothetical protein GCM10028824_34720 [Hymenobacter segetis]|uniref:Fibronectin type III domain-containing protein n=1 Tax=Hymenobacter segetis TaxID=2025509 RepID=A0ABU9LTU4_9BACT
MKRIATFCFLLVMALLGLRPLAQAQTCAAPTNVAASSLSPGTAAVSFTPSATATSYTVRYYWVYDSLMTNVMSVNTTTSPVTITGLRGQTYYRVSVVSNCAGGLTTASSWTGLYTSGGGTVGCGAVTNLVNSSSTASTSTVSFTPVAGALNYTVRYHLYNDTTTIGAMTVSGSPVVFTGLAAGATYGFTIVAHCASGTSAGATGFFSSQYVAPGCAAISNVSTTTTSYTASVSFTPVPGVASYFVQYHAVGSSTVYRQTATASPIVFATLQPGTSYTAEIFSNCGTGGYQSQPATVNFTTPYLNNCAPATNVVVTATSPTTATVTFTPGTSNTTFRIVSYAYPDSSVVVTTASPAVLTGLVPGRTYYIRVISGCGTGSSVAYAVGTTPVSFVFRGALAARAALGAGTVEVYPNPAHRSASLVLPAVAGAAQARLTLLNALGQAVRTQTIALPKAGETRTQLDLADVPPGLYTLRVAAAGQTASQRLAVE